MEDKQALFDYMNDKNGGRASDPITQMAFFAHGTAFDVFGTIPNPDHKNDSSIAMGYSAKKGVDHNNALNILGSDLTKINSSAFAVGSFTYFGTCRTGAEFNGVTFAQSWVGLTGGTALAAVSRTQYYDIYPDERGFLARQWGKTPLGAKAAREVARAKYGFSAQGSLSYPDVVSGGSWKMFSAN